MRKAALGLVIGACVSSLAYASGLDGRYERPVTVQNADGTKTRMVDFVEIQAKEPSAIFFVYESWHTNGHACRLWGTAKERAAGVYEYREQANAAPGAETCNAVISVTNEHLVIEDVGGGCRSNSCGARGEIGKDYFPIKDRRKLKGPVQVPW
jgi:hypothetical protein